MERFTLNKEPLWPLPGEDNEISTDYRLKSNEDGSDSPLELRKKVVERLTMASHEFQSTLALMEKLRVGEHVKLRSYNHRDMKSEEELRLPAKQRIVRMQADLAAGCEAFRAAAAKSSQICQTRRSYARDLALLRKRWRLVVLPSSKRATQANVNEPQMAFFTGDRILVDCGFSTAGDKHAGARAGLSLVPLIVDENKEGGGGGGASISNMERRRQLCRLECNLEHKTTGEVVARAVLPLARDADETVNASATASATRVEDLHTYLLRRARHVLSSRMMDYLKQSAVMYHDAHIAWTAGTVTEGTTGQAFEYLRDCMTSGVEVLLVDERAVAVSFTENLALVIRLVPESEGEKDTWDGLPPNLSVKQSGANMGVDEAKNDDGNSKDVDADAIRCLGDALSVAKRTLLSHFHASSNRDAALSSGAVIRTRLPFRPCGDWSLGAVPNACALAGIAPAPGGHAGLLGVILEATRRAWQRLSIQDVVASLREKDAASAGFFVPAVQAQEDEQKAADDVTAAVCFEGRTVRVCSCNGRYELLVCGDDKGIPGVVVVRTGDVQVLSRELERRAHMNLVATALSDKGMHVSALDGGGVNLLVSSTQKQKGRDVYDEGVIIGGSGGGECSIVDSKGKAATVTVVWLRRASWEAIQEVIIRLHDVHN